MNLRNLWLLTAPTVGPYTVISDAHPDGVVATIFSTQELAFQAATGDYYPLALNSLWQARVLAGEGYAGLLLDGQTPVFWVTTDTESPLPTHVGMPHGKSMLVIGEEGVTDLTEAEVGAWRNLPKFDQRTNTALLGAFPFYGYHPAMPLYEYLTDDNALTLAPTGGSLLQQEGDARESVALFSTPFAAEWYWEQIGLPLSGDGDVAREIVRHDDLVVRLDALTDLPTDIAIILNPGRHRFYQGFFRYLDRQWYLITINGLWHLAPPFQLTQLAKRSRA
jgi:hypothetical protein